VPAPASETALTVSELTERLREALGRGFGDLWVRGEVSQPRRVASGHLYLTLKDEGAVCPCVVWRSTVQRLRFLPEEGQEVLARGGIDVYPPHGRYQLILRSIEALGAGALRLAFERLRKRLEAEGLFDPAKKVPLPPLPRRIALVTSPTGAAVRDLVSVIRRRFPPVTLLLRAVRVQGEGAAAEIAAALAWVDRRAGADVIVVGRGGGSGEDLQAFNEEVVARAVAACETPVVSAVGHEHDVTICDLVADVRAATPSQAGELVVPVRADLLRRLAREQGRLARGLRVRLDDAWQRVEGLGERPALRAPGSLLRPRRERLEHLGARLRARSPLAVLRRRAESLAGLRARVELPLLRRVRGERERAAFLAARLERAIGVLSARRRERMAAVAQRLEALSPEAVLRRGFSLTLDARGHVLRTVAGLAVGDAIRTRLGDASEVESRVEALREPPGPAGSTE
jgi:exodeoxyribonuclease VII large subunit